MQARDAAALLIDGHPQRQLRRQRLQVATELRDLLGCFDVACEERDAPELKLTRQRPHFGRDGRAGQRPDQQLADLAANR